MQGSWDNAKKMIEEGFHIGDIKLTKGLEATKQLLLEIQLEIHLKTHLAIFKHTNQADVSSVIGNSATIKIIIV